MLRIAVDFDNVLADTTGAWIEQYNRIFKKSIDKQDIKEYRFWNSLHISRKLAFKIFFMVWSDWKNLRPLEQKSGLVVDEISKFSEVDLVSSSLVDMHDWLSEKKYLFNKIIYTSQKSKLNYDIFVDDSPYVATEIIKKGGICLLYDQPWNRLANHHNNLIRIRSLFEAPYILKRLA